MAVSKKVSFLLLLVAVAAWIAVLRVVGGTCWLSGRTIAGDICLVKWEDGENYYLVPVEFVGQVSR